MLIAISVPALAGSAGTTAVASATILSRDSLDWVSLDAPDRLVASAGDLDRGYVELRTRVTRTRGIGTASILIEGVPSEPESSRPEPDGLDYRLSVGDGLSGRTIPASIILTYHHF